MKIHPETQLVEQFLHKHTGLEFCYKEVEGRAKVTGLQISNLNQYDKFIKKYKSRSK